MIPPQLTQIAIQEIVENIWGSFLELTIQPAAGDPDFPAAASLLT